MPASTTATKPARREGGPSWNRGVAYLRAGALLLGAGVVAATVLAAWGARERALVNADREARNTALMLADHTERAIQAVDLALEAVLERGRTAGAYGSPGAFADWASSRAVHDAMRERVALIPPLDAIVLLDREGIAVGTTRIWPPRLTDNSDREYFRALVAGGTDLHFGVPIRSRATGHWALPVSRRIEGPGGEFLGVAVAPMSSAYFAGLHGVLALGERGTVALVRSDGILLTRSPVIERLIGAHLAAAPGFAAPVAGAEPRLARVVGLDGVERLVVGRDLSRFPLRVHVGLSVDAVLEQWRAAAWRLAAGAVALLAILAVAVAAAVRAIASESRAADERLRLQGALASEHADFRLAMEGMSQAVWRFGPDGRMLLTNGRCGALLGLPAGLRGAAAGMTLEDLERTARAAGANGPAELIRRLGRQVEAGEPASFLHDLADGRTVALLWRPMGDGGWLATMEDVTERHAAEARARFLARHDALTGLPNRLGLQEHLGTLLPRLEAEGGRAAVLYMDLDRFKEVNDTLGHPAGDALLRAVVERIRRRVRASRGGGDFVARLGGDEFAVVTAPAFDVAVDSAADAARIAERLVQGIGEPFDLEGKRVVVGASIGIALCPADGTSADALLRNADLALYRAKQDGRGRHCFFEPSMGAAAQARRALELELRRALEAPDAREFVVQYQPMVEVATRGVTGFEALLRWRHPDRGLIPPADFVPLAEEIGLIGALGELVLRRACAEAARWPARLHVAVNVSALQFRQEGLVDCVLRTLAAAGLDPRRLELEITEGALLRSTEATLASLHRLRAAGVRVALDDFGTGYSSLSYLLAFPLDKIKVDRSFVGEAVADAKAAAIVRAVATLCGQLGVSMTAEGVETEAQLRLLAAERCREAQGYLFGRAVDAEEVPAVLARLATAAAPIRGAASAPVSVRLPG